jgi:hypothetical protein
LRWTSSECAKYYSRRLTKYRGGAPGGNGLVVFSNPQQVNIGDEQVNLVKE